MESPATRDLEERLQAAKRLNLENPDNWYNLEL